MTPRQHITWIPAWARRWVTIWASRNSEHPLEVGELAINKWSSNEARKKTLKTSAHPSLAKPWVPLWIVKQPLNGPDLWKKGEWTQSSKELCCHEDSPQGFPRNPLQLAESYMLLKSIRGGIQGTIHEKSWFEFQMVHPLKSNAIPSLVGPKTNWW